VLRVSDVALAPVMIAAMDDDSLVEVLRPTRSVAVVGVSPDPNRPSHGVAGYLLTNTGWDVYLVNPNIEVLFGREVYASLADLPVTPDLVDVFRRTEFLRGVTDEAIAVGAATLWFQLGLRDDVAAARAVGAGLTVIQDRCLKVEHARLEHRLAPG
jgi:predicted CoA-binding protein